jgi:hypothetical protein
MEDTSLFQHGMAEVEPGVQLHYVLSEDSEPKSLGACQSVGANVTIIHGKEWVTGVDMITRLGI